MPEFIGKPIEVEVAQPGSEPAWLVMDGHRLKVDEVLCSWQDYGFGGAHPAARTWRTRRHRNYYRVRCEDGHTYDIYLDRGSHRRQWHLYRRVD